MEYPMTVEYLQKQIDSFKTIKENWIDGCPSISVVAIDRAKSLVHFAESCFGDLLISSVFPSMDGGVRFEWDRAGWWFLVAVDATGIISMQVGNYTEDRHAPLGFIVTCDEDQKVVHSAQWLGKIYSLV